MGNGIYEFFIKRNYNGDLLDFYIDFRDDDWPGNYPCGNDIYVYYSGYNQEVWIRWGETSCDITYPHNKTFYQIWTQKGKSFPTTTLFNNFWQNCLVIIPTNNNHPKLVWGPNPVMSNDYYKIYKKKDSPDFILYDSTTSDSYVDINEDIVTGPHHSNETDVYYKVTSVGYPLENPNIPPYESGYTNTADVRVSIPPPQKPCVNNSIFKTGYSLAQNYPNPFNPTTKIDYSIKSAGFVSLKVYNMLGEEVATLINKNMEPGSYSVTFDASNLPSGIYVYRLSSRNFSLSKKLILLK